MSEGCEAHQQHLPLRLLRKWRATVSPTDGTVSPVAHRPRSAATPRTALVTSHAGRWRRGVDRLMDGSSTAMGCASPGRWSSDTIPPRDSRCCFPRWGGGNGTSSLVCTDSDTIRPMRTPCGSGGHGRDARNHAEALACRKAPRIAEDRSSGGQTRSVMSPL